MSRIDFFISYAHQDEAEVKKIVAALEDAGAICWYAPRDVKGRYAKAIVDAIAKAKVFLLCLSLHAATSEHVLNEVEMAYNKKRNSDSNLQIAPLCIGRIEIDAPEFDEINYYIRRIHFIDPSNPSSPKAVADEIIQKNRNVLGLIGKQTKRTRTKSAYYASEREDKRLRLQDALLKKFDFDVYQKEFAPFDCPKVLDVGCGNGNMLIDRLESIKSSFLYIGLERDEGKIEEGVARHGSERVTFVECDVEEPSFADQLMLTMQEMGIDGFDVINLSMLLLHLKSPYPLLRRLRRLLAPRGVVVIKDIDDGINFAYPDDKGYFERIYRICDSNETSGDRRNGRQMFTGLYRAGFRDIRLEKQGFSTIGLTYDEKEAFWGMYFHFIWGDIKWMHEKYPEDERISDDCEWYSENYETLFEQFMRDDFIFSLGLQMYTAR